MTWSDARAHCKKLNGDLASFESAEEVGELSVSSSEYFWIGWQYNKVDQEWFWSDGSSTIWSHWGPGKPNKGSSCAQLHQQKLFDWPCTSTYHFVCKIPGMEWFL